MELRSAVSGQPPAAICGQRSAICGLRPAACDLRIASWNPSPACKYQKTRCEKMSDHFFTAFLLFREELLSARVREGSAAGKTHSRPQVFCQNGTAS